MNETETKILDVDTDSIRALMTKIGAFEIQDTKLIVDWFRLKGTKEGEDPWYLRIRSNRESASEVTWKGKSDILGASRTHKEINFSIQDGEKLSDLFGQIGLEKYAHQEKFRTSWTLRDWRFDLDQYPGMPAYLEIEGKSENHIQEAIKLLALEDHKHSSEGERLLIQTEYKLDWYNMKF
ncbi:MAG: CYTH domain-containing protein [Candidatus Doudnabacteria bacterium]|nr:CYTH domain-containing protein [Candidatus Doudnabacteria bacterium]